MKRHLLRILCLIAALILFSGCTPISQPAPVVDFVPGNDSLALTESGKVYGWGENNRDGQNYNVLGINSTENVFFAPQQLNIPPVQWISAGDCFNLAMDASDQIYAWGRNASWTDSSVNILLAGKDVESVSTPQPFEFNID